MRTIRLTVDIYGQDGKPAKGGVFGMELCRHGIVDDAVVTPISRQNVRLDGSEHDMRVVPSGELGKGFFYRYVLELDDKNDPFAHAPAKTLVGTLYVPAEDCRLSEILVVPDTDIIRNGLEAWVSAAIGEAKLAVRNAGESAGNAAEDAASAASSAASAKASAEASAVSEANALQNAGEASASATAAARSEAQATRKAGEADASAIAAAGSEAKANQKAGEASASATAAAGSEAKAKQKASEAAASATAAAGSEAQARQKSSEAAASASTAMTKATEAGRSASMAASSASSASEKAGKAASSASAASESAGRAEAAELGADASAKRAEAAAEGLVDSIAQIKGDISEVHTIVGDASVPYTMIEDSYISYNNGRQNPIGNKNYFSTDYIPIRGRMQVRLYVSNDLSGTCFYDADKLFISGYNPYSESGRFVDVIPPDGARYVRFSSNGRDNYPSRFAIRRTDGIAPLFEDVDALKADADGFRKDIADLKEGVTETDISSGLEWVSGRYVRYDGVIGLQSNYAYTQSIRLVKGETIAVHALSTDPGVVTMLSAWRADGTFIRSIHVFAAPARTYEDFAYTATDTEEYVRVCAAIVVGPATVIMESEPISDRVDTLAEAVIESRLAVDALDANIGKGEGFWAYAMQKVLCIGDSLTSGANYKEDWGEMASTGASIDQNIPRILGRMLGADVTNGGFSGYSASTWWTRYADGTMNKGHPYDFADYDTFIIWLGTNNGLTDTLAADVEPYTEYRQFAETETGYYCRIIEAIRERNPSCLIALVKVFASKGNVATTNAVIDKIAARYGLPVIDNSDLGASARPDLHAGVSNPHFGKAGNVFIAQRYVRRLGEWFAENPLRCEYGYTARTN